MNGGCTDGQIALLLQKIRKQSQKKALENPIPRSLIGGRDGHCDCDCVALTFRAYLRFVKASCLLMGYRYTKQTALKSALLTTTGLPYSLTTFPPQKYIYTNLFHMTGRDHTLGFTVNVYIVGFPGMRVFRTRWTVPGEIYREGKGREVYGTCGVDSAG